MVYGFLHYFVNAGPIHDPLLKSLTIMKFALPLTALAFIAFSFNFHLTFQDGNRGLFVSSFNIRKFGRKKMRNGLNVETITRILIRYDLIFIQEIVDKSQKAIHRLIKHLNKVSSDQYNLTLSDRVGKEQYAYIYKPSKLTLMNEKIYPDKKNLFKRAPYVALFRTSSTKRLKHFAVIGIHTNPQNARYEIGNLTKVYGHVKRWASETDMIFMGDFNAGCSYFSKRARKRNRLYNTKMFKWVIPDSLDTTVNANTECAYDR